MSSNSIIIYLTMFILTLSFTFFAEKFFYTQYGEKSINVLIGFFFSIIAILTPCILAAVRDTSVGGDISVYVLPNYNIAVNSSSFKEFYLLEYPKEELLFSVLIYLGAKLHNIGIIFFLIEIFTIAPIYYVLYKRRDEASMTIGMGLFLFLFYNFSLSGMRQSIAMSFMLLAYYLIISKKKRYSVFWIVIAALFHSSVLLIVPIYLFAYMVYKMPEKKRKKWYLLIMIILIILFFFYNNFASLLQKVVGVVSGRYAYYISNYLNVYSGIVWGNIHGTDFVCKLLIILLVVLMFKLSNKFDANIKYMVFMLMIGRYFVLFNAVFYESLRFAYYFDYLLIIFIPCVIKCVKNNYANKLIISIGILLPAFMYWIYFIMMIGGYSTNIYKIR